jgi:hypothetical protein
VEMQKEGGLAPEPYATFNRKTFCPLFRPPFCAASNSAALREMGHARSAIQLAYKVPGDALKREPSHDKLADGEAATGSEWYHLQYRYSSTPYAGVSSRLVTVSSKDLSNVITRTRVCPNQPNHFLRDPVVPTNAMVFYCT